MRHIIIAVLPLAMMGSLGACDQFPKQPASKKAVPGDPLADDLDRMEAGIRIAAANKRIDELERKVGALEATPERIDLDLLTQRVTALEVKSVGEEASVAGVAPPLKIPLPRSQTPPLDREVRQSPGGRSKLTLPDLENRPRLATPAEAKAFSPGK